ncbi:poly(ethylene terephthalate) hydrolase family protein [Pleomorphovibrio marinus]|uniref:poly(ethylene terephthalate) hydrolase family protein n=1 Tax=Pleomorphovibrio marinus TaxID=2164132 RepID=UPI000E0C3FB4|nr:alpha/beta hydrolase [Pleomorphovibrio marinus]
MNQIRPMPALCVLFFAFLISNGAFAQANEYRIVEGGGTGSHPAQMMADPSLPTHTLFLPQDLSSFGESKPLPVIAWGNGACYNSPWEHVNFLNEVASHGFLVVAIGLMPKEQGEPIKERSQSQQLLDAIDWAIAQNGDKNSPYYQKIDTDNIAVSGMSCGGLQALEVAHDPRISTIVVCNSGLFEDPTGRMPGMPQVPKSQLNNIETPTLYLLGGESDIAYNNGMDDFKRIDHVPVFVGNLDVGHGGTYAQPYGGDYAKVATAWYQWQLKGDQEAAKLFSGSSPGLAEWPGWKVEKKQMP